MPKGKKKRNQKHRRRRGVFAAPEIPARKPSGKRRDRPLDERCGPTEYLVRRLAESGPTSLIQRLAKTEVGEGEDGPIYAIDADQAQALERFAMVRRIIGVAEAPYAPALDSVIKASGGEMQREEVVEWAMDEYRAAVIILNGVSREALDGCTDITDERPPMRGDMPVREGSRALADFWVRGIDTTRARVA